MIINKKGLETQVLITTIIAIVSLIVIGVAIAKITGIIPSTLTQETCHSSVLARGVDIKGLEIGKFVTSLKCKTEYKCLTMGGECPKGYEKIPVVNEEEIKGELANSMHDCWWMLGEGKIQFWDESTMKSFGLGGATSTCSICSIIKFDDKIKSKNYSLDMAKYMSDTKIPGKSITYLEYFSNQRGVKLESGVEVPKIDAKEDYAVLFSGIKGTDFSEIIKNDVTLVAGGTAGSLAILGPSKTAGAIRWTAGKLGTRVLTSGSLEMTNALGGTTRILAGSGGVTAGWVAAGLIALGLGVQGGVNLYNSGIVASYCDGNKKGCMQVMMVPWNAEQITTQCGNIESIP